MRSNWYGRKRVLHRKKPQLGWVANFRRLAVQILIHRKAHVESIEEIEIANIAIAGLGKTITQMCVTTDSYTMSTMIILHIATTVTNGPLVVVKGKTARIPHKLPYVGFSRCLTAGV